MAVLLRSLMRHGQRRRCDVVELELSSIEVGHGSGVDAVLLALALVARRL